MGLLDGLMNNPKLISLAFSKLAGVFEEKHLEYIVLSLTDDGKSVKADFYGQGEIIITKTIDEDGINDNTNSRAGDAATGEPAGESANGGQTS